VLIDRRPMHLLPTALVAATLLLAGVSSRGAPAARPTVVPTAGIADVRAFGEGAASPVAYVASSSGLYRSAAPPYAAWARQSARGDIDALSVNPAHPDRLVYVTTGGAIYRSVDGGRSATPVAHIGAAISGDHLARPVRAPSTIYAATIGSTYALYASRDDGITWTTPSTGTGAYESSEGLGPIAVGPTGTPLIVGLTEAHGYGAELASYDGGHTLDRVRAGPLDYTPMSAVGIDPIDGSRVWVAWSNGYLSALQRDGQGVTDGLPLTPRSIMGTTSVQPPVISAIGFDPLTGRVYLATGAGLYATPRAGGPFERFLPVGPRAPALLAVLASGYALTGDAHTPLAVRPLIAPGAWPVAPPFRAVVRAATGGALGRPIAPTSACGAAACQYFEKGRLDACVTAGAGARGSCRAYGALARALIDARVGLPVGGDTSSVTYAGLQPLTVPAHRVAPPRGFHGGTAAVVGGTFVPASARLAPAPGYIVPPYFWRYATRRDVAPDGWLRDLGLPLTPAVAATVTKGAAGKRLITVQAFERAVLTYDPLNPAPFRVERANCGLSYATAFSRSVR